jgi:periplasmic protein TonB
MAAARLAFRPRLDDRPAAPRDRAARYAGIAGALAFHAVLVLALVQYAPVRQSLARETPIMVSVIAPSSPDVLPPLSKPPVSRKPVPKEMPPPLAPIPEPPPVATASLASSPIAVAPPLPPQPPALAAEPAIAPEPSPVIPPSFTADYLKNPPPSYPALARRLHEQGRVLIRVLVSVEGSPERIELKASSGHPRLDEAALETIKQWKFVPARQGDQSIAAWVIVPIAFTLNG